MVEKKGFSLSGWSIMLLILIIAFIYLIFLAIIKPPVVNPDGQSLIMEIKVIVGIVCGIVELFILSGLFIIQPNEAKVLQFFGHYIGTVKKQGLRWTIPFFTKRVVSIRIRNFETTESKVNDNHGNPIETAAIIVWKVVDTAKAIFEVDDYINFVHTQSEAALRSLIMRYPYDNFEEKSISLVTHTEEVSEKLKEDTQSRLNLAGVDIIEARISHLAYSSEVAASMLKRQQAIAIIAARKKIVQGAVGMVESTLDILSKRKIVNFSPESKAQIVSNLLVVLCSEQNVQPTLETKSV
jgi:regulator of protease activity HflC (stomatin/prohibitin superfamily)